MVQGTNFFKSNLVLVVEDSLEDMEDIKSGGFGDFILSG